jgi:hypothetical protein
MPRNIVFTFGLKGGYDAGIKLVSNVNLFSHLASIGDTRSLITTPPRPRTASSLLSSAPWPALATIWCACPWGWKIAPTSSPIWSRLSARWHSMSRADG